MKEAKMLVQKAPMPAVYLQPCASASPKNKLSSGRPEIHSSCDLGLLGHANSPKPTESSPGALIKGKLFARLTLHPV